MRTLYLTIGAFCLASPQLIVGSEIVETTSGKVKGSTGESRDGRKFDQFLGIPYAKAKRFMLPVAGQPKLMLPVIVWFHGGGGDVDGAKDYGPEYYMDTDIVLVTFNARLGFLGYLNLGTELASGNQRLKDQVQMLKWVQKNIENFGGDPARVTINGGDSGGAEVGYHLISPMSKGLLAGAVTIDGVAHMPHMFIRNPTYQAKKFGLEIGCSVETKSILYDCLMGKSVKDLVLRFHRYTSDITDAEFLKFGPSAEKLDSSDMFLTENPYVLLRDGKISNKVPWIAAVSLDSGSLPFIYKILRDDMQMQKLNTNINNILPRYLDYDVTANDSLAVTEKIMENYFGGNSINEKNFKDLVNILSDRLAFTPTLGQMALYNKIAPSYGIAFKYVPTCSYAKIAGYNDDFKGGYLNAITYQFTIPYFSSCGINKSSPDYQLSKNFVRMLSSFAENGKPKPWGETTQWSPYNTDEEKPFVYYIDQDGKTGFYEYTVSSRSRFTFWNKLFKGELASEFQISAEEVF